MLFTHNIAFITFWSTDQNNECLYLMCTNIYYIMFKYSCTSEKSARKQVVIIVIRIDITVETWPVFQVLKILYGNRTMIIFVFENRLTLDIIFLLILYLPKHWFSQFEIKQFQIIEIIGIIESNFKKKKNKKLLYSRSNFLNIQS